MTRAPAVTNADQRSHPGCLEAPHSVTLRVRTSWARLPVFARCWQTPRLAQEAPPAAARGRGCGDGGGRGPLLGSSRELPPTWVSACQAWGWRVGATDRAERSCWDRWVRRPAGTQGPVLVTGPGSSPGRWPSAPDGFAVTGALLRGRKPEEGCSWPWLSFPDAILAGRPILQTQLGPGERAAGGSFLPPLPCPQRPAQGSAGTHSGSPQS